MMAENDDTVAVIRAAMTQVQQIVASQQTTISWMHQSQQQVLSQQWEQKNTINTLHQELKAASKAACEQQNELNKLKIAIEDVTTTVEPRKRKKFSDTNTVANLDDDDEDEDMVNHSTENVHSAERIECIDDSPEGKALNVLKSSMNVKAKDSSRKNKVNTEDHVVSSNKRQRRVSSTRITDEDGAEKKPRRNKSTCKNTQVTLLSPNDSRRNTNSAHVHIEGYSAARKFCLEVLKDASASLRKSLYHHIDGISKKFRIERDSESSFSLANASIENRTFTNAALSFHDLVTEKVYAGHSKTFSNCIHGRTQDHVWPIHRLFTKGVFMYFLLDHHKLSKMYPLSNPKRSKFVELKGFRIAKS